METRPIIRIISKFYRKIYAKPIIHGFIILSDQGFNLIIILIPLHSSNVFFVQVSTKTGRYGYLVNLKVVVPRAAITGPADRHVQSGSTISLVCTIQGVSVPLLAMSVLAASKHWCVIFRFFFMRWQWSKTEKKDERKNTLSCQFPKKRKKKYHPKLEDVLKPPSWKWMLQ